MSTSTDPIIRVLEENFAEQYRRWRESEPLPVPTLSLRRKANLTISVLVDLFDVWRPGPKRTLHQRVGSATNLFHKLVCRVSLSDWGPDQWGVVSGKCPIEDRELADTLGISIRLLHRQRNLLRQQRVLEFMEMPGSAIYQIAPLNTLEQFSDIPINALPSEIEATRAELKRAQNASAIQ